MLIRIAVGHSALCAELGARGATESAVLWGRDAPACAGTVVEVSADVKVEDGDEGAPGAESEVVADDGAR